MKQSNSKRVKPPSPTAFRTAPPNSAALRLISVPSVDAISFFTTLSTTSAFTTSFLLAQSFTTNPIFKTSVTKIVFRGWSECIGQAAMGTPIDILSMHEFHPQWLMNPPVEEWPSISNCGAQPLSTIPLPLTLSSNPLGSSALSYSISPASASLKTHINLTPAFSNPTASS